MKGKSLKGLLFLTCFSGVLFAAAIPSNIISNGGFESDFTGWNLDVNGDVANASGIIDSVTGDAHEGNKYLRITVSAVSGQNWQIQLMDPVWTAKKGAKYTFTMWARADSPHKVGLSVYGDATSKYTYRTSADNNLTTEWAKYSQEFIADADGAGQINFAIVCGNEIGVYDIDDVTITETIGSASDPLNIISNGGFEVGGTGWNLEVNGDIAKATGSVDTQSGDAHEGNGFYHIVVTAVSDQNWHVQMKDPDWMAKKGNKYTFSMWARADSSRKINLSVYGDTTSRYTFRASSECILTSEWKQYSREFIADADGMGQINFAIVCGNEIGVYDIDNVVITEAAKADGNLYSNSGFETESAGWSLTKNSATAVAAMTFPSTGAKEGAKFGRIEITTIPEQSWQVQLSDGSWSAKIDSSYKYQFWAKADAGQEIEVAVQTGSTRSFAILSSKKFTLTNEWTQYEHVFKALLGGPDSINVNIFLGAATGVYDFDNITLTETDPLSVVGKNRIFSRNYNTLSVQVMQKILRCTVNSSVSGPLDVSIYSASGRLLSSTTLTTNSRFFDLQCPPRGLWIVGVKDYGRNIVLIP